MMPSFRSQVLVICTFLLIQPAIAQENDISISFGPQVSTLGIGAGSTLFFQEKFSISTEFNILPIGSRVETIDGITYDLDPTVRGMVFLANFHPGGNGFSLGVGAMFGGYQLEGVSNDPGGVVIGDMAYTTSQVGVLTGDFEIGGPSLAAHVGWRGKGFNFGLGIFTLNTSASLNSDGPINNDPTFRAEVDQEVDAILSELEVIPVIPYIRIGYQFGIR